MLGIDMDRRIFYLTEALAGIGFFVASGVLPGGDLLPGMIQPGLYAQEVDLSLSGIGDQIGDGLSAGTAGDCFPERSGSPACRVTLLRQALCAWLPEAERPL